MRVSHIPILYKSKLSCVFPQPSSQLLVQPVEAKSDALDQGQFIAPWLPLESPQSVHLFFILSFCPNVRLADLKTGFLLACCCSHACWSEGRPNIAFMAFASSSDILLLSILLLLLIFKLLFSPYSISSNIIFVLLLSQFFFVFLLQFRQVQVMKLRYLKGLTSKKDGLEYQRYQSVIFVIYQDRWQLRYQSQLSPLIVGLGDPISFIISIIAGLVCFILGGYGVRLVKCIHES